MVSLNSVYHGLVLQDEAGTAAVLSSALDDQLGGLAVQYREIQGKESNLFLQVGAIGS